MELNWGSRLHIAIYMRYVQPQGGVGIALPLNKKPAELTVYVKINNVYSSKRLGTNPAYAGGGGGCPPNCGSLRVLHTRSAL